MASLHFCSPASKLLQIDETVSTPIGTSFTSSNKFKSSRVRNCRLKLFPQKYGNIVSQCDKCDRSFEASSSSSTGRHKSPLNIGIIGLGASGQFLVKPFQRQGNNVLATSRSDYSEYCKEHDIEFFQDLNSLCETQPDILLVCTSILSTEKVVRGIPFHKLKPGTIIADILSVKQFSKNLLVEVVPPGFGIICTHPMFGKFTGTSNCGGLRFVYEKVRITHNTIQERKCEQFLDIFQDEGCKMVEMSCEEHDRYAAESQFVTHTMGRILSNMNLGATPIDTKGYETLRELTQNTDSHGSDLYDGMFLYNVNTPKQIQKLETAFDEVKKNLFAKLRESFKRQMEEAGTREEPVAIPMQTVKFLPSSEKVLKNISSFAMIGS